VLDLDNRPAFFRAGEPTSAWPWAYCRDPGNGNGARGKLEGSGPSTISAFPPVPWVGLNASRSIPSL